MAQGCKAFYHGKLLPLNGKYNGNIGSEHRMTVLTWNCSKLPL